jgi:hypothetical protein
VCLLITSATQALQAKERFLLEEQALNIHESVITEKGLKNNEMHSRRVGNGAMAELSSELYIEVTPAILLGYATLVATEQEHHFSRTE